jgi:probable HAF family extracellular repeat protein
MIDLGVTSRFGWSDGVAINELGEVAGQLGNARGVQHPFVWRNGKIRDLGSLGGSFSEIVGMNDLGQVVGSAVPANGSVVHATLWHAGKVHDLGTLGGAESDGAAISPDGHFVVGVSATAGGKRHAVLWTLPAEG